MGADHTAGYTIATNILNVGGYVDPLKKEGQVELSRNLQIATAAVDSTGMCIFVAFPALDIPECLPALIDMINARFGIALTGDDVINLGKTVLKTERKFNIEAGFTNQHDRLPEFFNTSRWRSMRSGTSPTRKSTPSGTSRNVEAKSLSMPGVARHGHTGNFSSYHLRGRGRRVPGGAAP
jgi:aldehyde:ferredoxin oxidoreductase